MVVTCAHLSRSITKCMLNWLTFPLAVLNNNFIIIGEAVNVSWKLAFFFFTTSVETILFLRRNRSNGPLFSAILLFEFQLARKRGK